MRWVPLVEYGVGLAAITTGAAVVYGTGAALMVFGACCAFPTFVQILRRKGPA